MKKCSRCNIDKALIAYHKNKTTVDGLHATCKTCRSSNESRSTRAREYDKKYKQENKELLLEKDRIYNSKRDPIHTRILHRDWVEKNRALKYAINAKYRARKREAIIESSDFALIQEFYKEAQARSSETGTLYVVDHIIPLNKGGLHHQDNLQVITESENSRKSDISPENFYG